MQKLKESKEISANIATIYNDLKGEDSLACIFALRYCAEKKITDEAVIDAIYQLKNSKLIEWASCKVSDCAVAALHILGVERYTGDNIQILDMISSNFFRNRPLPSN